MKRWMMSMGLSLLLPLASVQAQEVVLRHSLQGKALDVLATQTLEFNDLQKGKGRILLQNANSLSATDKVWVPQAVLFDPDDAAYYFPKQTPRFMPLYQVFKEGGEKLVTSGFYPQIADVVADDKGRIEALPLGMALPVLFFNKEAFIKAKLDPNNPPRTWMQVQDAAGKLQDAGYACPLTSTYFARLHVENVATQHGQAVAGKSGKAMLNTLINVKHLALIASWQRSNYFRYYGPRREAEDKFLSGECAMITDDSTLFARLAAVQNVNAGATELPYHDDNDTVTPTKVMPDGASLWVVAGQKKADYKLLARYIKFLMEPKNQSEWVKATAYLPMDRAAMAALRDSNAFTPRLLDEAEKRLSDPRKDSGRIRDEAAGARLDGIIGDEVQQVWTKDVPPKEALDDAMTRYNAGKK